MTGVMKYVAYIMFLIGLHTNVLAHTNVTPTAAKNMVDTHSELIVIDVRAEFEYCGMYGYTPHIPGALNYPWSSGDLQGPYEAIPHHAEILLVCASGSRSHEAARLLDSKGYLYVYDMLDGMPSWPGETVGCIDTDLDGINDDLDPDDDNDALCDQGETDPLCSGEDNCSIIANSSTLGTCVKTLPVGPAATYSYRVGSDKHYITCTSNDDCDATDGTCQLGQGDWNNNGAGDVCECLMDCNNEGAGDGKITGLDLNVYKLEYGRDDCRPADPCYADGNGDDKVTGLDLNVFKNEYGRDDCPAL